MSNDRAQQAVESARQTQPAGRDIANAGTTVYQEIDLKSFVDARFATGEGVLTLCEAAPDSLIVMLIKQALAAGKPFTVVPVR
ncbi:hypothetical protein RN01_05165 [Cupriavidus sp. SHE]|uniref:hypothetical protein n=1 Tax=Cupriavidus TaxID=106589 RepID=UPI000564C126|nr:MULTISPECIES: hypothetical protein [Cupriavidus]KWR85415.1 hypothetical protein RN01_05165 [Cupriavidus sp. SHE]GMG94628.1 hypothetical protein Cmtc_58480 [Cupriavidus sp. TKC]